MNTYIVLGEVLRPFDLQSKLLTPLHYNFFLLQVKFLKQLKLRLRLHSFLRRPLDEAVIITALQMGILIKSNTVWHQCGVSAHAAVSLNHKVWMEYDWLICQRNALTKYKRVSRKVRLLKSTANFRRF